MKLTVNGQEKSFEGTVSVSELLQALNLDPQRVAVEHNRTIVLREEFATLQLADGDALEIVQFVGGG
mgnify:CR=1 FL=1